MPTPFVFDRTWRFDVPRSVLWEAVSATDQFPRWWPWLRAAEIGPLATGTEAAVTIQPPLPYRLRLTIRLTGVEPGELVEAAVTGDVAGPARLELADAGTGSAARLAWALDVRRPALVAAERVARPVMEWGHDAVVSSGVRRFHRVVAAAPQP